MSSLPIVLVTGATGVQGGGVTRELLSNKKFAVRALVRDPNTSTAKEIAALGAELIVGEFDDVPSLEKAVKGVYGVFSVQKFDGNAVEQVSNLVDISKKAGVNVFVQVTVASAGLHTTFPKWGTGYYDEKYWLIKHETEEVVKKAGFPNYTILQPATYFENYLAPRQAFFYPDYSANLIKLNVPKDFNIQWLSAKDIGVWANAVFETPSTFNKKSLGVGEHLSMGEITEILSEELNRDFKFEEHPAKDLLDAGYYPEFIKVNELLQAIGGYKVVSEDERKAYNVPAYSGFRWFVRQNKDKL